MSILSNKLKLEVKSNEAEVAKFISTEKQADIVFIPREKTTEEHTVFSSKTDDISSNIFQASASISTDSTQLASFKYTNTDLTTTAIVKGNLIIDGSALALGTVILNDENDTSFSNIMPRSPYSNLISERYTSLLYSNINSTSNTITTTINSLYNTLNTNLSNIFSIQRLFAGISFTSFSDTDFDNRLLTRTTDNLQNGSSNTFIINNTHPNNLVILNDTGLNTSNLITNTVNASTIVANKLIGDGSRLTNIYANNNIDATTDKIPELPYPFASNLYYTAERVLPIILSSNMEASNFILSTSNNLIAYNMQSEENNSNYIFNISNYWFTTISTDIDSLSNIISTESCNLYLNILASNNYISNIIASFEIDTQISTSNSALNLSNYIFNASNIILNTHINSISNTSNLLYSFNNILHTDIFTTSNSLVSSIIDTSNALSYSLYTTDIDTSNYMQNTSNSLFEMASISVTNNSNNISNIYYVLDDTLQSNLLNSSNIILYIFDDLSSNLTTEDRSYSNLIDQVFTSHIIATQTQILNTSNYTSNIYIELSNLSFVSYDYSSNMLYLTSNVAYNYSTSLYEKITNEDLANVSNYVLGTSNNLINFIYSNFMNQFADISTDITVIADNVNQRIDLLTADIIPEGNSNYFSSNLFKTKIRDLTLDDIKNGVGMQYICNNMHPENLTIMQQLSASNLTISGTETVLMTNVINADQLEIMSASFNDALTVKQTFVDNNIMEVWTNNNPSMIVKHDKIGIKTVSPVYELDVLGTVKATAFIASGEYLQNVNLADKSTADLVEHPSQLYYTPERAGLIISYCNILVSNYIIDTSNAIRGLRNSLIANEIVYANNMSNAVSISLTASHISQSNYVSNASNQLMVLAYARVLNENQSNYVRQVHSRLNSYVYELDGRQSNYVLQTSNNLSRMLVAGDSNNSNYIAISCNINLGQLATHSWNASNYIRITSNALLGQLFALENPQSNYIRMTSNTIVSQFLAFNNNMSNYAIQTSNITSNMFSLMNLNNSNHISNTSNSLMRYIIQSVANLQTSGSGNVSATATYINRWNEPTNYITNSTITSVPFNYISYNDGSASAVGIGVSVPSATLDIYTVNPALNSIKVSNNIWAQTGLVASSDARIKKDIVDIDDGTALQQILAIEPKIYNYKDSRRQTKDVYGFIAQQVAEVIPNAVRLQTACIPDIYCYGVLYEKVLMINEDEPPVLQENDKIGILCNNEEYILVIEDIYSENTFQVDNVYNLKGTVFIYGRVVNDFHTIDKDYIYTLNVCATQDLYRQQQCLYAHMNDLKSLFGYNALDACSVKVEENIDVIMSIDKKTRQLESYNKQQTEEYLQLWNINKNLANIVVSQDTNIRGRIDAIQHDNMKLKQENHILANNNSNLKNMIMTMSDRILHIRGILQRNNII